MALSKDQRDAIVNAIESVQSALDDFAAVGDSEGAEQLGKLVGGLMVACEYRASAIKIRAGKSDTPWTETIEDAMQLEASSDTFVTEALAVFGR